MPIVPGSESGHTKHLFHWGENSSVMKSTNVMKRLIIPNHVILLHFQFYTLILVFPDATPRHILYSKPVLWKLNNTGHNLRSVRLVLETELSANNKIQVIRSPLVPVLRYSFGTINWHQEE